MLSTIEWKPLQTKVLDIYRYIYIYIIPWQKSERKRFREKESERERGGGRKNQIPTCASQRQNWHSSSGGISSSLRYRMPFSSHLMGLPSSSYTTSSRIIQNDTCNNDATMRKLVKAAMLYVAMLQVLWELHTGPINAKTSTHYVWLHAGWLLLRLLFIAT